MVIKELNYIKDMILGDIVLRPLSNRKRLKGQGKAGFVLNPVR